MDPLDPIFRVLGASCVLAGYLGARSVLVATVADKVISALSGTPEAPEERARRALLASAVATTGAGGVALTVMSFWALPIFVINVTLQALWLWWNPAPSQDDEEGGRRVSGGDASAALICALAAVGVGWAWQEDMLAPWDDPVATPVSALAAIGFAGWISHGMSWLPSTSDRSGFAEDEPPIKARPARVVIDPAAGRWPLCDADTGRRFSHFTWLDGDLAALVEEWDDLFQVAFPLDELSGAPEFASAAAEALYRERASEVARELEAVFGTGNVSFGRSWPPR